MVSQIEQGVVDVVLVYKLDRLSRSQRDTLHLIEEVFLENNVDFVSMNESFDTSTPFGRAMIGILSVFAQLEREQIRERSMMGKEARAKEGKWHGGGGADRLATGYDYMDGALTINEYEASCIQYIFDEYVKGHGIYKIFKAVSDKFPGILASETTIRNILCNPLYIGKIQYKGEVYEGLHDPIISDSQFQTAQELIKKRTSSSEPFRKEYLMSGVMYCGHCGARMFGRTGGRLKDGTPMKYYVCYSRQGHRQHMVRDPNCMKRSERKERLEESVINEIKKVNINFMESYRTGNKEIPKKVEALEKEIKSIDKQLSKMIDLYSLGNSPIEIITEKIEKLKSDRDKLKKHIYDLENELEVENIEEIKETVSQLADFDWSNGETDKKRLIVAKLINKIIVSNDNITIEWAF